MKNILLYAHGIVAFLFTGFVLSTFFLSVIFSAWVCVPQMKVSALLFCTALLNTFVKRNDPPAKGMASFVASGAYWIALSAFVFLVSLGQWRYPSLETQQAVAQQAETR